MSTEKFANSASTTLNGSIGSGDLSLVVASATHFPTQPQFRIICENEVMLVTGVAGTTFTVTRGQEGTTNTSHANGRAVTHILTSGSITQLKLDTLIEGGILKGSGDPEGAVVASVGTLYLRLDGSTSTTLYIKETGVGNTGWAAK